MLQKCCRNTSLAIIIIIILSERHENIIV